MFKSKILLTLTLLASVASLTACGQKATQSTTASSQTKVVKTSSTSSSSLPKTKTTTSTEAGANQDESSSEASATETGSSSAEVSSTVASSVDLDAIANGDFSSIAGTWRNAQGKSFTFTADGLLSDTDNVKIVVLGHEKYNQSAVVTIGSEVDGKPEGGALGILIYPAGVKTAHGEADERDHLQVGHSINKENPEERFYRE